MSQDILKQRDYTTSYPDPCATPSSQQDTNTLFLLSFLSNQKEILTEGQKWEPYLSWSEDFLSSSDQKVSIGSHQGKKSSSKPHH